jgi:hypothetical protein
VTVDWSRVEALQRTEIGRYTDQPEVTAHLDRRARMAALLPSAPALPVAVQLVNLFGQPAIPLDRRTLEPLGDPITTEDGLLDWWAERPVDHVGVATGPRGAWTMAAVKAETMQGWLDWLVGVAGVTSEYEDGYGRIAERKELRPYGRPGAVIWTSGGLPPSWASGVLRGNDLGYHQAAQILRERQRALDRGGWLLFAVPADEKGRLPRFAGKRLAADVHVLGDGAVVPVWSQARGGWTATLTGFPDATAETVAPPWFASILGAK